MIDTINQILRQMLEQVLVWLPHLSRVETLFALQVTVSTIYLFNKAMILAKKDAGWLVGVVASLLGIAYYLMLHRPVYVTLNVGLAILMAYGFFKVEAEKKKRIKTSIQIFTAIVVTIMGLFSMNKMMNLEELGSSIALIMGTYFLTHDQRGWGWVSWIAGHILGAGLGYVAFNQDYFAKFQIASAVIALVGAYAELESGYIRDAALKITRGWFGLMDKIS